MLVQVNGCEDSFPFSFCLNLVFKFHMENVTLTFGQGYS